MLFYGFYKLARLAALSKPVHHYGCHSLGLHIGFGAVLGNEFTQIFSCIATVGTCYSQGVEPVEGLVAEIGRELFFLHLLHPLAHHGLHIAEG